jgi:Glycosyl transferase family 2
VSRLNRFRKVLCLSLDKRADYTRALLESLSRCEGIEDYQILANIEEGSEETMALALSVDFAQINISVKSRAGNFSERAFNAIDRGFGKAEFAGYVDGDTAVTSDFLRYLEYAAEAFRNDSDLFLVSCDSEDGKKRKAKADMSRRPARLGPAIGIWRNRWEWSKRTGRAKAPEYLAALAKLAAKYRLQEVYPLVSLCYRLINRPYGTVEPHAAQFRESSPPLTAVMITGLHRERYAMARIAIECFKAQTYPNKSLFIVNHGEESLNTRDPRIRELRFQKSRWHTVGDLRNLGLEYATGDFIINWDDDDWHHPKRMEVQMRARARDTAVLLRRRIHHSLVHGSSRYAEYPKGAEATILHPRRVPFRYPSLVRGSDTVFAQQFPIRLPIENDPAMHIRFFHGLNLWDAEHIMGHLAEEGMQGKSELREEHRTLLAQILPLYGRRLGA